MPTMSTSTILSPLFSCHWPASRLARPALRSSHPPRRQHRPRPSHIASLGKIRSVRRSVHSFQSGTRQRWCAGGAAVACPSQLLARRHWQAQRDRRNCTVRPTALAADLCAKYDGYELLGLVWCVAGCVSGRVPSPLAVLCASLSSFVAVNRHLLRSSSVLFNPFATAKLGRHRSSATSTRSRAPGCTPPLAACDARTDGLRSALLCLSCEW